MSTSFELQTLHEVEPKLSSSKNTANLPRPKVVAIPTKLKIPFKPVVPLTYEAKGKSKMDDALLISSPKQPTTQNADVDKAKKPRKSKIFQPKYPSLSACKGQNKQVYVPKE